jgi:Protein of unknown function (DUF2889)
MAFESRAEVFDDIAPHPDGVEPRDELLHERAYVVRSYRKGDDLMVIRGAVRDQKPPGLYIPDDPQALTVHHMIVDLHVAVPSLEIVWAKAELDVHPHLTCKAIEPHYENLVGLSIARGFTHKVRELFGGPRGCTHTTALLQAMGPVAIQSMWSFRVQAMRGQGLDPDELRSAEAREAQIRGNLNTCHVWAEDGEQVASIRRGDTFEVPVWIARRFTELGRDPETWRRPGT